MNQAAQKSPYHDKEMMAPRLENLLKLLDAARYMGVERNIDRLLMYLVKQGTEACEVERSSIFLLDEKAGEIWSKIALEEDEVIRFPRGRGIAGECIDSQKIIMIPDAYQDQRFNRDVDKQTGFVTKSILTVPMTNLMGKTIGCFQLVNKLDGEFSAIDESFALAFASQAAVAIESAVQYTEKLAVIKDLQETQEHLAQKVEQLQVVYEIEKSSTKGNLEDFLEGAINQVSHALAVEGGSFYLLANKRFDYIATKGTADKKSYKKHYLIDEISKKHPCFEQKGPVSWINDNHPYLNEVSSFVDLNIKCVLSVPIMSDKSEEGETEVQGILEIYSSSMEDFSMEYLEFVTIATRQIAAALEKRRLLAERLKSDRLATIGQLSSSIIHDFRNPMTAIRGVAHMLSSKDDLSRERASKYSKMLKRQVGRCNSMIEELLSFARGTSEFSFASIPLTEIIEEVKFLLEIELEEATHITLNVDCQYNGDVKVDRDKFIRVIFNLTGNALDIMKEGGTLSINALEAPNGQVHIKVRDTGPGVPEDMRETLFSPFVTAGKKNGTGLGLHIARSIIKNHEGPLFLDSTVTSGACFVISLDPKANPRSGGMSIK